MPASPVVSQRGKRKSASATTTARKRVRIADHSPPSSSTLKARQQTLTQLQFVDTPGTKLELDDADLQALPSRGPRGSAKSRLTKSGDKRKSTLTQMQWLQDTGFVDEEFDDSLIETPPAICQSDGATDRPSRKTRRTPTSASRKDRHFSPSVKSEEKRTQHLKRKTPTRDDDPNTVRRSTRLHARTTTTVSPKTPSRSRQEIPSSESPRTLLRSHNSYVAVESPSRKISLKRSPLKTISSNIIPLGPQQKGVRHNHMALSSNRLPKQSRHLKGLSKPQLTRLHTVADSQEDVYTLQVLSSPCERSTVDVPWDPENMVETGPNLSDLVEIPESSQTIDSTVKDPAIEQNDVMRQSSSSNPNSMTLQGLTKVWELEPAASVPLGRDRLVADEARILTSPRKQEVADSEWGSPNEVVLSLPSHLQQRESLPDLGLPERTTFLRNESDGSASYVTIPTEPIGPSPVLGGSNVGSQAPLHTLPLAQGEEELLPQGSNYTTQSQSVKLPRRSENQVSLTAVPLNDTLSSSPPMLPPVRWATQKSIHPASLPRASQISTQYVTQCLPSSSVMNTCTGYESQRGDDRSDGSPEQITIKSSSSQAVPPISQIPRFENAAVTTHQAAMTEDSDSDIEDLDLDPTSAQLVHYSAQKAALHHLQREQSLRTLSQDKVPQRQSKPSGLPCMSSSPTLQAISSSRTKINEAAMSTATWGTTPDRRGKDAGNASNAETQEHEMPEIAPTSSPSESQLDTRDQPHLDGFNNETQSNFTQNGHVSAAYIHRQRALGVWPEWYTPPPYQVSDRDGTTKSADDHRSYKSTRP